MMYYTEVSNSSEIVILEEIEYIRTSAKKAIRSHYADAHRRTERNLPWLIGTNTYFLGKMERKKEQQQH